MRTDGNSLGFDPYAFAFCGTSGWAPPSSAGIGEGDNVVSGGSTWSLAGDSGATSKVGKVDECEAGVGDGIRKTGTSTIHMGSGDGELARSVGSTLSTVRSGDAGGL